MPMRSDGQRAMTTARSEERIERANSQGSPRLAPAAFGERFLRHPDLFPARQSGERWGEERVVVRFAGSDYVCAGLSTTQAVAVRERFGALCPASAPAARPSVNSL